jgi:hypothetical protein
LHADHIGTNARIVLDPITQVAVTERSANLQTPPLRAVRCALERGDLIGVEHILDHGITVLVEATRDRFRLVERESFQAGPVKALVPDWYV